MPMPLEMARDECQAFSRVKAFLSSCCSFLGIKRPPRRKRYAPLEGEENLDLAPAGTQHMSLSAAPRRRSGSGGKSKGRAEGTTFRRDLKPEWRRKTWRKVGKRRLSTCHRWLQQKARRQEQRCEAQAIRRVSTEVDMTVSSSLLLGSTLIDLLNKVHLRPAERQRARRRRKAALEVGGRV